MIHLPTLSQVELEYYNCIAHKSGDKQTIDLPVIIDGNDWWLHLSTDIQSLPVVASSLGLHAAEQRCWIGFGDALLQELSGAYLADMRWEEVPDDLRMAVIETYLANLLESAEQMLNMPVQVSEFLNTPPAELPPVRLAFSLTPQTRQMPRIDSYLACPETLVGVFTQALIQLPDAVRDWPQLPIAVHFEVGSSQLSVGEFAALEPDDLIFLERGPWLEDGSVMIRLAANFGWRASVEGDILTLQSLEMGMAEEELFEEGTAPLESLDELPITLSFDLGRQTLPYKEIKMLQPGYTFELAKTQEKPVNLRANGRAIGKGELVQVGDYLGVRVIELYPHDND